MGAHGALGGRGGGGGTGGSARTQWQVEEVPSPWSSHVTPSATEPEPLPYAFAVPPQEATVEFEPELSYQKPRRRGCDGSAE